MSKQTLWVLVLVLGVLAGAMWMNGRRAAAPAAKHAAEGVALLPSVELSTVRSITLEDGAVTTHLAQVEGVWCVAEQDNYPADLNRLREMLRSIDGTENAQVAEVGSAHLAEFGLATEGDSTPLRIALEHEKGTTLLSLGKLREPRRSEEAWRPAAGRYVRVDEGPVLLIKEDIRLVAADPAQWWDRLLLEVPPESIRQVEIRSGDGWVALNRGTNGTFALRDGMDGEEVEPAAANRLFGALRYLRAESLLPASAEGAALFTNAVVYQAELERVSYRIQLGEAQSAFGDGRPIQIEVTASADATPDQQAAATTAGKKLGQRTFLISAAQAESMSLKKDVLVRKSEPAPEPPPTPEEVAPAESAES